MLPPAGYLIRAKDFADARYGDQIAVDDLAAAAGLSRAHFSRMFTRTWRGVVRKLQTMAETFAEVPDGSAPLTHLGC